MTPTNDAPVTVEQADIAELRAFLATYVEESDGDLVNRNACDPLLTWGILRRLAALASAPAGDGEGEPITGPVADAKLGLYRVHWASGGSSLSAIGMNRDGSRWLAPTNWTAPATCAGPNPWWFDVERLEPINPDASLDRPRAAVGEREAATQMLRDCADDLTSTASHHGQYAAIDQDKIDGLRDAVRNFDALQSPPAKVEG